MRRLLLFLLLSAAAFAQGVYVPPQTAFRTTNGITYPLANASITVCAANASGIPCAPVTVSIFSDAAETHPLSNPFQADSNGNYIFAVSPGTYTVTVTGTGFTGNSYQISVPVNSGTFIPTPPSGGSVPGLTFPARFDYVFARGDAVNALPNGSFQFIGGLGNVSATATEVAGNNYGAIASASTNTIAQLCYNTGANPGQGFMSIGTVNRWAMRVKPTVSSPVRYWLGLIDTFSSQCSSPTSITATDTPNLPYVAFRFSSGTDTVWQACAGTATASQTCVSTGVAINISSSTLFEIGFTGGGATATFYINGTSVATITTNLPTAGYNLAEAFFIDNKNTATAESLIFYYEQSIYNK